jgi:hypothetical protein
MSEAQRPQPRRRVIVGWRQVARIRDQIRTRQRPPPQTKQAR